MNNVEHKLGQLDYGNRAAITDLVDKMLLLQGKADSNFQKVKIVKQLRIPSNCIAPYVIINDLKKINDSQRLEDYKNSQISKYNEMIADLTNQHNENLDAINSNRALKAKIIELFTYIGIHQEYSELKTSGARFKTIKHRAGYLSDLDRVCITNDYYDNCISTIQSHIAQVEREFNQLYGQLQHKVSLEHNKSLFYKFNHHAVEFNVDVKDVFDFIKVKRGMLTKIDNALGNLYNEKVSEFLSDGYDEVQDVVDAEIDVVNNIIFNNKLLIDDADISLLKLKYYTYNHTKNQILGA